MLTVYLVFSKQIFVTIKITLNTIPTHACQPTSLQCLTHKQAHKQRHTHTHTNTHTKTHTNTHSGKRGGLSDLGYFHDL